MATNGRHYETSNATQKAVKVILSVDKATKNTASGNDSLNKLDGLLKEFKDAVKSETT